MIKILAHLHTYGNNALSGADKMMQSILESLVSAGAECTAAIDACHIDYNLNGVNVVSNRILLGEQYEAANLIITHLVPNHESRYIAKRFNKPVLYIAHNSAECRVDEGFIVYNSKWLQKVSTLNLESIVVHPPTKPQQLYEHYTEPYITLVNTCGNKGGEMFYSLAMALPHYKFLGVHGGYGQQLTQPLINIMYRSFEPVMDYSDTKILLVPSITESWSMCAAEAMARGIPVICSNLPGLKENCGPAAIYCTGLYDYISAIDELQHEYLYRDYAALGNKRIIERNNNKELQNLFNFVLKITGMDKSKKLIAPVKEKKEVGPIRKKQIIKP